MPTRALQAAALPIRKIAELAARVSRPGAHVHTFLYFAGFDVSRLREGTRAPRDS